LGRVGKGYRVNGGAGLKGQGEGPQIPSFFLPKGRVALKAHKGSPKEEVALLGPTQKEKAAVGG